MKARSRLGRLGLAGLIVALAAGAGAAQQPAPSSGMASITANRGQPVQIESTTLEVRDKSRIATFMGNVKMTQGDTIVQAKTLIVYYEDNSAPSPTPAANAKAGPGIAGPGGGQQQIKRMEAKGNVIITQKEQTASGDSGLFDVKANTVTLIGNVVVTQGQNVLNGERMVVNLDTGVTRVESSGKAPVRGLVYPNAPTTQLGPAAPPAQKDAKSVPPPPAPAAPAKSPGPKRIN
jgi:lipopolysaccharide export system protein LptA